MNPEDYLSTHFQLKELTVTNYKAYGNTPNAAVIENLKRLCNEVLEPIRECLGRKPLYVSSGYRSFLVNKAAGGAANSYHTKGLAADLPFSSASSAIKACFYILTCKLPLAELILCKRGNSYWVHVALALPGDLKRIVTVKQYGN